LGVKFRPSVDGYVTSVRFYKGPGNTGTHTGSLWTESGNLLAWAVFANETATGWQEVQFPVPVPVTANTVYVASYHAPNGHYAYDSGYFLSSGVNSGPLTLPRTGESGGNGVYAYGSSMVFPTNSHNGNNYWVDVVLVIDEEDLDVDTTPPGIVSRAPVGGSVGVGVNTSVTVTSNETLDPNTLRSETIFLRTSAGALVPAAIAYDVVQRMATLTPLGVLTGYAYAGCDPRRMGLGPVFAMAQAEERLGLSPDQADLVEINEAFAAQVLAVLSAARSDEFARTHLGRDRYLAKISKERLNVNGGAIALGHPVGATGARLILSSLKELNRRNADRALVSLCVGGGQGAAVWLERMS